MRMGFQMKAYDSVQWRFSKIFSLSLVSIQNYPVNKVCLYNTYSKIWTCKPLFDMFPIKNGLKEDALLSLLSNFALECAIRKVKANHKFLKFNGTHQVII